MVAVALRVVEEVARVAVVEVALVDVMGFVQRIVVQGVPMVAIQDVGTHVEIVVAQPA